MAVSQTASLDKTEVEPSDEEEEAKEFEKSPTKARKPKMQRQLSWYVGTRSYRAPEIVLMVPNYDTKFDVWAAGVVLAELLKTMKDSVQSNPRHRTILFQARSCYPMSPPKNMERNKKGEPIMPSDDLFSQIIDIVGTPSKDEIGFITEEDTAEYIQIVRNQKKNTPKMDF